MANKKRNRIEMIYGILTVIMQNKNSIRATPLMRKSNLSSERFQGYLKELLDKKFINEIIEKNNVKYYSLSDKGFAFIDRYASIKRFIDEFEL